MKNVRARKPKPLTPVFARRLRGMLLGSFLLIICSFAVISNHLLYQTSRRSLLREAQLCAAALIPESNGDLSSSVARLRERNERLIAVGTLNAAGGLEASYPAHPAHRVALLSALKKDTAEVTMPSPVDHGTLVASGIIVPLNGSNERATLKVLILLKCDQYIYAWARATALFTLLVGATGVMVARSLKRWLDLHVAKPLQSLADAVRQPLGGQDLQQVLESGRWYETAEIAEQFLELLESHNELDARAKQLEVDTLRKMRQQEIGFDRQLRRAEDQARTDPLTKLQNRSFLDEQIEQLMRNHSFRKEDLSAVMMDVDNFKQYNDTHGHQVGDALLRFAGALLRGGIRPQDHAIRYGGDEFLLLLPGTDARHAVAIAERLVKLFCQYTKRLGHDHMVSMSAGVSSLRRDHPETGHDLIAKADVALYAAKHKGKNTVADAHAA